MLKQYQTISNDFKPHQTNSNNFKRLNLQIIESSNYQIFESRNPPPLSLCSKAWSCRESNPGPNKKRGCFLHAYSVFDCREKHGDGHPNSTLSPKISPPHRRIEATSPVFFAIALPKRNQTVQSSDVSFQHLVPELR